MKISTRGEYGIRAMLYVAWMAPDRTKQVQSREISRAQYIPEHYLKHILSDLRTHGFIKSSRGPHGGHWLARPAEEISIADVVLAMEGQLTQIEDILLMPCQIEVGPASCAIKELWIKVKEAVEEILEATTLAQLVEKQRALVSQNIDGSITRSEIP